MEIVTHDAIKVPFFVFNAIYGFHFWEKIKQEGEKAGSFAPDRMEALVRTDKWMTHTSL